MTFPTTTLVWNTLPKFWAIKDNRAMRLILIRKAHPNLQKHDHPPEISRPRNPSKDLMTTRMTTRLFHRAARQNGKATHIQTGVKTATTQQRTTVISPKKTPKKKAYLDTDRSASLFLGKSSTSQVYRKMKWYRRQIGSTTHTKMATR